MDFAFKPLLSTFFYVMENNFTLMLNRRAVAKKLTLKTVNELKKERCANSQTKSNDDKDVSTWTCEFLQSFLKKCNAVVQGNKAELHCRCNLLQKLIYYDLEN